MSYKAGKDGTCEECSGPFDVHGGPGVAKSCCPGDQNYRFPIERWVRVDAVKFAASGLGCATLMLFLFAGMTANDMIEEARGSGDEFTLPAGVTSYSVRGTFFGHLDGGVNDFRFDDPLGRSCVVTAPIRAACVAPSPARPQTTCRWQGGGEVCGTGLVEPKATNEFLPMTLFDITHPIPNVAKITDGGPLAVTMGESDGGPVGGFTLSFWPDGGEAGYFWRNTFPLNAQNTVNPN